MRVVAGKWKGRSLQAPGGRSTRPTSDRVREAIFSAVYSLSGDLAGAVVVDLYAGSGALGIEALSRGADSCVFVDSDRRAADAIARNLRELGAERSSWRMVQAAVNNALALKLGAVRASLLLADPPYRIESSEVSGVFSALGAGMVLEPGGLVVYEHSASTDAMWPPGFEQLSAKRYGDTAVSFARYEGDS
jgi:16S rRNA (guanine966-N2)-methyltransferase